MTKTLEPAAASALVRGECRDPFALLGPHAADGGWAVRAFRPLASELEVIDRRGATLATMRPVTSSAARSVFCRSESTGCAATVDAPYSTRAPRAVILQG